MKASDFIKHLNDIKDVCEIASSSKQTSQIDYLLEFKLLFKGKENQQVKKVLEGYANFQPVANGQTPRIESLLPLVKAIKKLLNGCANKSLKTDMQMFSHFLESYRHYNIGAFVEDATLHQVSSSQKVRKTQSRRRTTSLDIDQINKIIERLKKNINDPEAFAEAYKKSGIEDMDAEDVRAIAKGIYTRTPKTASKKKAISLIKERHENLVKYHKKSKSMDGRTAA